MTKLTDLLYAVERAKERNELDTIEVIVPRPIGVEISLPDSPPDPSERYPTVVVHPVRHGDGVKWASSGPVVVDCEPILDITRREAMVLFSAASRMPALSAIERYEKRIAKNAAERIYRWRTEQYYQTGK